MKIDKDALLMGFVLSDYSPEFLHDLEREDTIEFLKYLEPIYHVGQSKLSFNTIDVTINTDHTWFNLLNKNYRRWVKW